MIYLFLGPDAFSKNERLRHLAEKSGADIGRVGLEDGSLSIEPLTEATLFGGPRLFVLENLISHLDIENQVPLLAKSPHTIVLLEDSLDKRKKTTTQWLKHKDITVEEFASPQGAELQQWLAKRTGSLGAVLNKSTADYFLSVVLPPPSSNRFAEPITDLWQVDSELRKLAAYANGQSITSDMVDAVTIKNNDVETWDIVNALAERNTKRAFLALEQFFADNTGSTDDKAKTIQLNALLAEQFRSILLVQDFVRRRVPDSEILRQTSWKSGRLFIIKKLAGKFQPRQLASVLDKLERLDVESKTTTAPGQTILQLITAQLN